MRTFGIVLVAAAIGLLTQVAGLGTRTTPVYAQALAVQEQFLDALNRGDAGGIESLLTPDFSVTNNANCTSPCDGRTELGVLLAIRLRVETLSASESGDVVTSRIRGTSHNFDVVAPGVTRVFADTRLVVREGKVASLDYRLDLTDPESAELARQFRATRGQTTGALEVQNQFVDALSRGNINALRGMVSSNFAITGNIGCSTPCAGVPYLEMFVTIRLRLAVLSAQVSGNTVTSRVSAESTRFDQVAPGVNRVFAQTRLTVTDGKVSALDIQLDVSDTLSAALAAELREVQLVIAAAPAPQPSTPARLPATGNGGLLEQKRDAGAEELAVGGVALLMVAAALLALRRRTA